MNVTAYQEKKKNDQTDKKKAGKERKQATNFKKAVCCPFAVVQRAAWRKDGLHEGTARGKWDPQEGQQSFRLNLNGVGGGTTKLRLLLISASIKRS